jgi:hypothetical protein
VLEGYPAHGLWQFLDARSPATSQWYKVFAAEILIS